MSPYVVNVVIAVVVCLADFCHVTRAADCTVANFNVKTDFNITAYAGRWYELNYKPPYFEAMYEPWMDYYEQYTLDNSTGTPQLNFTAHGRDAGDNYKCVGGSSNPLKVENMTNPAKMYSVKQVNAINTTNLDHWVIDTDYVTYAVIYGCPILNTNGTCQESTAKVYSRTRTITNTTVLDTISSLLISVCLNITMLPAVWQNATLCPEATTTTTVLPNNTTTVLPNNMTTVVPNNMTTVVPNNSTTSSGTELMASLPALLLTMLLLAANYQRHGAAV